MQLFYPFSSTRILIGNESLNWHCKLVFCFYSLITTFCKIIFIVLTTKSYICNDGLHSILWNNSSIIKTCGRFMLQVHFYWIKGKRCLFYVSQGQFHFLLSIFFFSLKILNLRLFEIISRDKWNKFTQCSSRLHFMCGLISSNISFIPRTLG